MAAPTTIADRTEHRPGRIARWKLTEPVLLYVYGAALLWVVASSIAAAFTGAWLSFASSIVAVLFTSTVGGFAARASSYSPRAVVATILQARRQ